MSPSKCRWTLNSPSLSYHSITFPKAPPSPPLSSESLKIHTGILSSAPLLNAIKPEEPGVPMGEKYITDCRQALIQKQLQTMGVSALGASEALSGEAR